jgi:hypothetical protein
VERIEPLAAGFRLHTPSGPIEAERVVLAAGLGNATLAPMVGLTAPVRPNKGQVLVLERRQPFLPFPLETMRQTAEGTVLLGDSQEDAGIDTTLGLDVLGAIARRAVRVLPALAGVRVIRAWAALRVLTPDGLPIYAHSAAHPGASLVSCRVLVDGAPFDARAGDSVAAALLASGRLACRETPVGGAPRGPYCLMGVCFDCLVTIDGVPDQQGCTVTVRTGMRIDTQRGAAAVGSGSGPP